MSKTRNNHYVPRWYQKGFLFEGSNKFHYLNLHPDTKKLDNGKVITFNNISLQPTSKCFVQTDLYTTFYGDYINDEIEQKLFGEIDDIGAKAVRAFIGDNPSEWHDNIMNFFEYIDAQRLRTPKGLDWIKSHYSNLQQNDLMLEMQAIRRLNITIWGEGVREIVSAKNSKVKFILSDNPVSIYNYKCPPEDKLCLYPNEPTIALNGTQTIFALDKDHCLILTNYDYVENPDSCEPLKRRINATNFRNSMLKTDEFIKTRFLGQEEVIEINYIIKSKARKYIASTQKEWLYPEEKVDKSWSELRRVLLPTDHTHLRFGGEMLVGYEDGTTYYQDRYGRTKPEATYLKKEKLLKKLLPNDLCGCGSGKKYKKCCKYLDESQRPSWSEWSIRERNLVFGRALQDILGLSKDKTWDDIRKTLSNEQVKEIHELHGTLWPIDTDIFSLLPKSNHSSRIVYSGFVDIRIINSSIMNLILYFDEIIIQNPFVNPHFVKEEFNPVHNAHYHKQQTLKNIMLFLTLLPYIELGYINLIPDITSFNSHLQKQMIDMAKERLADIQLHKKDVRLTEYFLEEEFRQLFYVLSDSQKKDKVKEMMPTLLDNEINDTLKFLNQEILNEPLLLLQKDLYRDDGQLRIINFSPNFEISLFLSQITNSILVTNSYTRLEEIKVAQSKISGIASYRCTNLTDGISSFQHITNIHPSEVLKLRFKGSGGKLRNVNKEIYATLKDETKLLQDDLFLDKYRSAFDILKKEIGEVEQVGSNSKFVYLAPAGGFINHNVQRMLLSYGSDMHMNNLPLVIFIEEI